MNDEDVMIKQITLMHFSPLKNSVCFFIKHSKLTQNFLKEFVAGKLRSFPFSLWHHLGFLKYKHVNSGCIFIYSRFARRICFKISCY